MALMIGSLSCKPCPVRLKCKRSANFHIELAVSCTRSGMLLRRRGGCRIVTSTIREP
jgi:hypothetical protein